jgi:hypothetical protein
MRIQRHGAQRSADTPRTRRQVMRAHVGDWLIPDGDHERVALGLAATRDRAGTGRQKAVQAAGIRWE